MSYREIARKSRPRVSTMAVYLALNPEKRTPRPPKGAPRPARPHSARTPLSDEEFGALHARARAEKLSLAALMRAIVFEGAPPLLLEPKEGSDDTE